jgi:hypothetical protein
VKTKGNSPLGIPRCRWDNNIKMDLQEVEWGGGMEWIDLTGQVMTSCECSDKPSHSVK